MVVGARVCVCVPALLLFFSLFSDSALDVPSLPSSADAFAVPDPCLFPHGCLVLPRMVFSLDGCFSFGGGVVARGGSLLYFGYNGRLIFVFVVFIPCGIYIYIYML